MSVITPKNKLSQKEYYASHSLKELAKNSLYISLMFGQVLWPMNSAMAAPVFIPDDGVEQTGSNEYTVTANRAIARWQSFVLDETETIKFLNQDGIENSILLNLVTSEIGSKIAGELNANNIQFILVDPSGINIAGSAKIDVSGLVLSTAGVSVPAQGDFKDNPNLLFGSPSNGKIIIDSGATLVPSNLENVVLIGKDIQNDANIKASGLVAMLATDNATLTLEGSNILGVSFNAESLVDASLVNNGAIVADKAFLANQATNGAIKIDQSITANKIVISGDKIELASSLNGTSPSTSNVNIGKGVTSTSESSQLSAVSELTIGSNSALSGFNDNQSAVKANAVNVKSEAYTKATITNNNKIILDGFSDISDVQSVSFTNNQNNGISTNSSALLTDTKNSLKTRGVTFSGISNANLGGEDLKGSSGNDTFIISNGGLQANNISITHLKNNTVDANGEATLSGADNNTWTITADKVLKEGGVSGVGGYVFTGLDQVAFAKDEAVLNGRGSDIFEFKDDGLLNNGLLEAASMSFKTAHLKQVNNTNKVVTHADAFLQSDNNAVVIQSLKTNGVIFTDVNTADLGGKLLTGSSATDSFVITSEGITANDIAVEDLNTMIDTKGNAELSGADKNTWTISDLKNLTASDGQKKEKTYTFTGLDQVAFAKDEAVLNGRGSDTFEFKDDGLLNNSLLEAASMSFKTAHLKQVNNTNKVVTHADAFLQSDDNNAVVSQSLKTNGVIFTDVNTADLGGKFLTGSSATDSFEITSQGIKANGIAVENLNTTIDTKGNASLLNAENNTWLLTDAFGTLKSQENGGYTFTSLTEADLNNESLKGSSGSDRFNIINGDLQANNILITNLKNNTVNANGSAILSGAEDSIWLLTDSLGTLQYKATGGYTFTDLTAVNLSNEGLKGSVEHNRFTVIGNKKLDAAGIEFTGVTSVVGSSNLGHVVANDEVKLGKKGHELTTQNISISGIGSVDLNRNILTATNANQNSFTVTGTNTLTAADINFKQVSNVFGYNKQGHVNANAAATLSKDNALSTQGIEFSDIGSMDLGGQTLIGSKSHDSFKIHTNGSGVNANGIEIVNLDRTINVNGAASLSGAQNNTWQLTNTTNTLEDSRDNGFVFVGVNDANLQGGVLSGSAAQNKFDITGAQKLTVADIDFSNVAEVNAYDNKGYVITNNVSELTDGKNQLKTQGVIINGVDQAYLSNNALKGSATGSTLELISESRVDASGIKFFDFGELDGNENTGALVSKLDAPQWTMTTANCGTVNNIKFKAFKTLENSVGDLKLNVGEKVGGVEFKGDNLNFGGNSSLVFNSQNNVTVNSTNNINGSLVAKDLNINTTGDVDLKTQIDSITLNANNANLVQEGDLVIHSIDVKRTLNLDSAQVGKNNLIAGNSGRINVKAKASLGEQGKWDNIGVNAQPLSFEVVSELALVANTTVAPVFPNGQPPIFNLEGDRSESLLSSHTNALIQNNRVSNDANANLALFEALSPIYIDKNAVAGVHVKDSRLDVPSELEMEMLAALLSKENPTAAGKPNKKKVLEKDDADET